jgi:biotin operon repressor
VIRALRGKPLTLEELSRALDRSAETVRAVIAEMQSDGYVIGEDEGVVQELPPVTQGEGPPPMTLADRPAQEIAFAVVSDTHGGDKAAQWTNLAAFVRIAREEFGCGTSSMPAT